MGIQFTAVQFPNGRSIIMERCLTRLARFFRVVAKQRLAFMAAKVSFCVVRDRCIVDQPFRFIMTN